MSRFPDLARSRAVLIGASHFTAAGPGLPDIPAVEANLAALWQALASPDTGVLRPECCRVLADPTSPDEVGAALSDAAATATDVLLVYYAGHGLVDESSGRLHLALARTHPHRTRWTALPFDLLREEIVHSAAAIRVLVLDCCFSGRAIDAMTDDQGVIGGQLEVAGTYTLTATPANFPAHAPPGDRYTAFTGALLRALDQSDPLTLDQLYVVVNRDLAARNLPRPQRRVTNTAGDLALSRGLTTRSHAEPPDSDAVQFTRTYRSLIWTVSRGLGAVLVRPGIVLGGSLLSVFIGEMASGWSTSVASTFFVLSSVGVFTLFIWLLTSCVFFAFSAFQARRTWVGGLVVDRSGLTLQRKPVGAHLPWRDIAQIGVLQPGRESLNPHLPAARYTRRPLLVVQLRPEVPTPDVLSLLSDRHRQLGYLGLCTLESVGSSHQEMINALGRFAGGKLVHSTRQFLDRDPRLRPEMV